MPTWIYLGHSATQINNTSNPASNSTSWTEAQALVGRSYDSSVMQGVDVSGNATGFDGANFTRGVDQLSYSIADDPDTPENEAKSATAVYTSHVVVNAAVTVGRYDDAGDWQESEVNLPGVIIQMQNGDMFLRPFYSSVEQWETTLSDWGIVEIHVDSVMPYSSPGSYLTPNTTDAYTGGLSATASFPPRLIGRPVDQPNPCFVAGTLVLTENGLVPVESIRPGDLVVTMDDGLQPVRWIASRTMHLGNLRLADGASMAPIRISAGALGEGFPSRDLLLSPQHRVLVRSQIAQRMFGAREVLVPVKQLLSLDGVTQLDETREVTYVHFMFDKHQLVFAEGAAVESLYAGKMALQSIGKRALEELVTIFPELAGHDDAVFPSARDFAAGKKARKLVARHVANRKPIIEPDLSN